MSLSMDQSDPERVEYHDWLLRIQDQQLREELLDIVSRLFFHSLCFLIFFIVYCSLYMVFLSYQSISTIGLSLNIFLFKSFRVLNGYCTHQWRQHTL